MPQTAPKLSPIYIFGPCDLLLKPNGPNFISKPKQTNPTPTLKYNPVTTKPNLTRFFTSKIDFHSRAYPNPFLPLPPSVNILS